MRILHQEYVESFDFDQLDIRHAPGLERAVAISHDFARANEFKLEMHNLLAAAQESGGASLASLPGLELAIEWSLHSSRIAILRDELELILKIAKGRPVPVSSPADDISRES